MLVEHNNNNKQQGLKLDSSDENTPDVRSTHIRLIHDVFGDKQQTSKNTGPQQVPSLTLRDHPFRHGNNIIPVFKQEKGCELQQDALKSRVVQILKNDFNRTNFGVLKEVGNHGKTENLGAHVRPKLYKHHEISTSPMSTGSVFASTPCTLHEYNSEAFGLLEKDNQHDISFDNDLDLETSARKIEEEDNQNTVELFELYKRGGTIDPHDMDHRCFSVLNPQVKYVTVSPPRMGKPLLPNDAPLDLSGVEKTFTSYPPLNESDKTDLSNDELKLFSILDYELQHVGSGLDWIGTKNYKDKYLDDESDEENIQTSKTTNYFRNIFKSFFVKYFNKDVHYENRYPWHRILSEIDNPKESTTTRNTMKSTFHDGRLFERNNTDMFPKRNNFFSATLLDSGRMVSNVASTTNDSDGEV